MIEKINGGKLDCSNAGIASFIGGAAVGGAIFFGWVGWFQVWQHGLIL